MRLAGKDEGWRGLAGEDVDWQEEGPVGGWLSVLMYYAISMVACDSHTSDL